MDSPGVAEIGRFSWKFISVLGIIAVKLIFTMNLQQPINIEKLSDLFIGCFEW
jgi:hypothetical protein